MLESLLAFSVRRRMVVLFGTLVLIAAGIRAFLTLPIDAVPDLTNVQVQVLTRSPSLGPLDVERLVTVPVERAMGGVSGVREIRSQSRAGVSAVTIVFQDDVDPWFARQQINERIPQAREAIPSRYGVPELGPMSTGLGEIYQFEVRGDGHSLMELRSLLDWEIAPRLRMVPGVVEVNSFGGELKTFEVAVDPNKMLAYHVSFQDVIAALEQSNRIAGGGVIERGPEGLLVRGEGLVQSLDDIRRVVVLPRKSAAVLIEHVATVRFAPMLRWGAASRDGRGEAVVGMAVMRLGENSRTVSTAIDQVVREINPTLPPGVRIETFYDRTTLVQKTLHTVARSLEEGGVLVVVVLFLLLRNLRAGFVAASMIPLCMLGAFLGMRAMGVSGNLMSLGAIDFGLVVDGAIILLENAVHHLAEKRSELGRQLTRRERDEVVVHAAKEVRGATAFGEVIIALVYVPILALEGTEGKMFRPMALTVLSALAMAFILSLTFVPALASLLLSRNTVDKPSPIVTAARWLYLPALDKTLRWPRITVLVAVIVLGVTAFFARRMGSEFVPRLDEGAFAIETIRLPSSSLRESVRQSQIIEQTLRAFPEVVTVITKTGRPEIATDPMGPEQSDVIVMLRPRDQWQHPADREGLVQSMSDALRDALPGVAFSFSQPIEMRTNELVSGVRSDLAVKIYGEDFPTLARLGAEVAKVIASVPGAADLRVDRVEGVPVVRVQTDREALVRRGARVDDVLTAIEAVGGLEVGEVLDGRRRYPLRVRLGEEARATVDAIERLPLRLNGGALAPLEDLAQASVVDEPAVVNHEAGQRRLIVQANVRGRDLGGFAAEAQKAVREKVKPPPGYRLEWGGQFENLQRAKLRLAIVVPAALVFILVLLYASFGAWPPALLIFVNVPFAAVGGVIALIARGLPFSISAAVGFIALFGVAVLNGLVLITQVRTLDDEGATSVDAAREGALRRLRPVLTTALVASLGFLPMAMAHGEGAEVQKPLATVVIGGLITATLLTLLVLPAMYGWLFCATKPSHGPMDEGNS